MTSKRLVAQLSKLLLVLVFVGAVGALCLTNWRKSEITLQQLSAWHKRLVAVEIRIGKAEEVRFQLGDELLRAEDPSLPYIQSAGVCVGIQRENSESASYEIEGLELRRIGNGESQVVPLTPTQSVLGVPEYPRLAYRLNTPVEFSVSWGDSYSIPQQGKVKLFLTVQRCQSTAAKDLIVGEYLAPYTALYKKSLIALAVFTGTLLIGMLFREKVA